MAHHVFLWFGVLDMNTVITENKKLKEYLETRPEIQLVRVLYIVKYDLYCKVNIYSIE